MFHYVRWASADDTGSRRWHAASVGLYFVLGFMTKFVAALFLPLTLAVATLLSRDARVRLARDRRLWCGVSILALVLIGPWFAFASVRFGSDLWQTMFQAHVVTRFTDSLDPTHVQPWHFYVTELYRWLAASDSHLLVLAGLALLVAQSISQRWFDGGLVVLWFGLPILFISAATSKIYHYAYPFLPPLALAGGYLAARGATLAVRMLDSGFRALDRQLTTRVPILVGIRKRPAVYAIFCGVAVIAAIAAAATIVYGPIRLTLGGSDVLRNSGIVRPLVVLALTGTLAGSFRATNRIIVAVILVSLLPIQAYRDTLPLLAMERHPMRTASECLARFESQPAGGLPGLYMDDRYVSHPLYYYFRRVRPVTRTGLPDLMAIDHYLFNPPEWRPLLLSESTYQDFMNDRAATGWRTPSPPMIAFPDVLLLLPGPFERCAAVPGVPARHRAR
jgi:4-amino-4-deoxy-L-arabinose transferase-like glycosyltransferase